MIRRFSSLESLRGGPRSGTTWQSSPKGAPSGLVIWIASLALAMTTSFPSQAQESSESRGRAIIEKHKETNRGYASQITLGEMTLIGKNGSVEATREFEHRLLEERGTTGEKSLLKI